jgi:hypothetical protein
MRYLWKVGIVSISYQNQLKVPSPISHSKFRLTHGPLCKIPPISLVSKLKSRL